MRTTRFSCKQSAFSLVELLIVLAIIATLVAILMPILASARESARRVKCVSNARQLSMAWLMYTNDNKGRFPLPQGINVAGKLGIHFGWLTNSPTMVDNDFATDVSTGMLWQYLQSRDVYICPSDLQRRGVLTGSGQYSTAKVGYSYSQNRRLGAHDSLVVKGAVYFPGSYVSLSQIKRTETTALIVETGSLPGLYSPGMNCPYYQNRTLLFQDPLLLSANHLGSNAHPAGCSVSFVDGHAIFWNYSGDINIEAHPAQNSSDMLQLAAWSGSGETPPGVIP